MCVTRRRHIEICNEAFARMFGYEQAELLDQPLAPLYPSLDGYPHRQSGLATPQWTPAATATSASCAAATRSTLFWCHVVGRALNRT